MVLHREAKKFDPMDEGSIVIAKGRDVALHCRPLEVPFFPGGASMKND